MIYTMCLHLCVWVDTRLPIQETTYYLIGLPDQLMNTRKYTLLLHRRTKGQICVTSSWASHEQQRKTSCLRIAAVVLTKH